MLSDYTPIATLATADIDKARAFYEGTLGLTSVPQESFGGEVLYTCGASAFLVYPSQFAGTNQATAMALQVDDGGFDGEIAKLRDAGVTFDTFDLDGINWEDGVAVMDGGKAVWFHDPDGNIINLMSMG